MRTLLIALAGAMVLCLEAPALTIDDFSVGEFQGAAIGGSVRYKNRLTGLDSHHVLGGARYVLGFVKTPGRIDVSDGALTVASNTGSDFFLELEWSPSHPSVPAAPGLNFAAGITALAVDVRFASIQSTLLSPLRMHFNLVSGRGEDGNPDGNASQVIAISSTESPQTFFASLSRFSNHGIDWSDIDGLTVILGGLDDAPVSLSIDRVYAIPEPSSGLQIALSGSLALVARAWRRTKHRPAA